MGLTDSIAKWIIATEYEDLPVEAVTAAKRAMLDTFGRVAGGRYAANRRDRARLHQDRRRRPAGVCHRRRDAHIARGRGVRQRRAGACDRFRRHVAAGRPSDVHGVSSGAGVGRGAWRDGARCGDGLLYRARDSRQAGHRASHARLPQHRRVRSAWRLRGRRPRCWGWTSGRSGWRWPSRRPMRAASARTSAP